MSGTLVHENDSGSAPRALPADPGAGTGAEAIAARILLVDDDPGKLTALEAILAAPGRSIVLARSGDEALRHLLQGEFAVVLLDVHMPGLNGFETAEMIRRRPRCEHLPIIFVSAVSQDETHTARGYALGAVDYIYSPIVPAVLQSKVAALADLYVRGERDRRESERARETQVREHRQELSALQGRLRDLVEGLDAIVWEADAETGHYTFVSQRAESMLGHPVSSWLGDPDTWVRLIDPADRAHSVAARQRAIQEGVDTRCEIRVKATSGQVFWLSERIRPVRDGGGRVALLRGVMLDITERKRAEGDLRLAVEELERSNRDLEHFASIASHDLREPLRKIAGYADLLTDRYRGQLDERADGYLAHIASGVVRLEELLRALLVYSKMSGPGKGVERVDLRRVLADLVDDLEIAIREAGAEVIVDELPTVPARAAEMRHLIQNLIENAIKFRGLEPCRIRVSAQRGEGDWIFSVADNGIGIEPAYWNRIFVIFERLHTSAEYPGTGVGLAICRKIVERHGGRIWVESEPGRGSTFYFTLPLEAVETAPES